MDTEPPRLDDGQGDYAGAVVLSVIVFGLIFLIECAVWAGCHLFTSS